MEIILDLQKSWSWGSNPDLYKQLEKEKSLPKPVSESKNLGSFVRYIDENQEDVLAQERHTDALHRLQQVSKFNVPLKD